MRRRIPHRGWLAGVLAVLALAMFGGAAAVASRTSRAPSRLLVSGDEYSLTLSRKSVSRGPAVIQFVNRGEDPHDLRLRRIGAAASRTIAAPEVRPGNLVELLPTLRAGRYRLWCSLPGHSRRGMHATLRVRGR